MKRRLKKKERPNKTWIVRIEISTRIYFECEENMTDHGRGLGWKSHINKRGGKGETLLYLYKIIKVIRMIMFYAKKFLSQKLILHWMKVLSISRRFFYFFTGIYNSIKIFTAITTFLLPPQSWTISFHFRTLRAVRSSSTTSRHLFLGLPQGLFPFGFYSVNALMISSSPLLMIRPNRCILSPKLPCWASFFIHLSLRHNPVHTSFSIFCF